MRERCHAVPEFAWIVAPVAARQIMRGRDSTRWHNGLQQPSFLALSFSTLPLAGQIANGMERAASQSLSQTDRDAVVASVEATLRSEYVFPAKTSGIIEKLEQARNSGRYAVEDAGLLAQLITQDLGSVSSDRHLYLVYNPARYALATNTPAATDEEGDIYDRLLSLRDNSGLTEIPDIARQYQVSQDRPVRLDR